MYLPPLSNPEPIITRIEIDLVLPHKKSSPEQDPTSCLGFEEPSAQEEEPWVPDHDRNNLNV